MAERRPPSAVGIEGLKCEVKGTTDPWKMRVIIEVPHNRELIEQIEALVDVAGEPLPVTAMIEPVIRQLTLPSD